MADAPSVKPAKRNHHKRKDGTPIPSARKDKATPDAKAPAADGGKVLPFEKAPKEDKKQPDGAAEMAEAFGVPVVDVELDGLGEELCAQMRAMLPVIRAAGLPCLPERWFQHKGEKDAHGRVLDKDGFYLRACRRLESRAGKALAEQGMKQEDLDLVVIAAPAVEVALIRFGVVGKSKGPQLVSVPPTPPSPPNGAPDGA